MPPFMNVFARDDNEAFFHIQPTKGLVNSLHRMGYRRREQYIHVFINAEHLDSSARILYHLCRLNMNAHHFFEGFFFNFNFLDSFCLSWVG